MDLTKTKSWESAQAAKAAMRAVYADPNSTPVEKKAVRDAYATLMMRCLREREL